MVYLRNPGLFLRILFILAALCVQFVGLSQQKNHQLLFDIQNELKIEAPRNVHFFAIKKDTISIHLTSQKTNANISLVLYKNDGSIIYFQKNINKLNEEVEIPATGVYHIELSAEGQRSTAYNFILKRRAGVDNKPAINYHVRKKIFYDTITNIVFIDSITGYITDTIYTTTRTSSEITHHIKPVFRRKTGFNPGEIKKFSCSLPPLSLGNDSMKLIRKSINMLLVSGKPADETFEHYITNDGWQNLNTDISESDSLITLNRLNLTTQSAPFFVVISAKEKDVENAFNKKPFEPIFSGTTNGANIVCIVEKKDTSLNIGIKNLDFHNYVETTLVFVAEYEAKVISNQRYISRIEKRPIISKIEKKQTVIQNIEKWIIY